MWDDIHFFKSRMVLDRAGKRVVRVRSILVWCWRARVHFWVCKAVLMVLCARGVRFFDATAFSIRASSRS